MTIFGIQSITSNATVKSNSLVNYDPVPLYPLGQVYGVHGTAEASGSIGYPPTVYYIAIDTVDLFSKILPNGLRLFKGTRTYLAITVNYAFQVVNQASGFFDWQTNAYDQLDNSLWSNHILTGTP